MSRFANRTHVEVIPLGACQCPGTPHEGDTATVRWDLGSSALARIGRAELDRITLRDPLAAWRQLVLEAVVSWNLLVEDEDGDAIPAPITPVAIAELDEPTLKTLAEAIDDLIGSRGTLPNASAAPSPASPRGSGSPTRKRTPKPGT